MQPRTLRQELSWVSFLSIGLNEFRAPLILGAVAAGVVAVIFAGHENARQPATIAVPAAGVMLASFWGWLRSNQRLRALEEVPLSKIATAAQGYARFEGRADFFPDRPVTSPTGVRCCWFRYEHKTYDSEGNVTDTDRDESIWSFAMSDGTGECIVDPAGASMIGTRQNHFSDKRESWTEELIVPRDPLCVLGQFTTSGGTVPASEVQDRVGHLLSVWKRDMPALLARFGARGKEFTLAEWQNVEQAARLTVEQDLARHPPKPQNLMSKPRDGREYVISGESHAQLRLDMTIWAWLYLAAFAGGAGTIAYAFFGR
ncbi:MAG: hypothetical protein JO035_01880 [Betaproteobacteria bacterium]|nr:hypothetical protein [Betaproteobacteria bacterium]